MSDPLAYSMFGNRIILPPELICMITNYLDIEGRTIPSIIESSSDGSRIFRGTSHLREVNKAWKNFVDEQGGASVMLLLSGPKERNADGGDDNHESSTHVTQTRARARRDMIVLPIGTHPILSYTSAAMSRITAAAVDVLSDAKQRTNAYDRVGTVALDSRITPPGPDRGPCMYISTPRAQEGWTRAFNASANFSKYINASFHVEADITFRPLIDHKIDKAPRVPPHLTWNSRSIQTPVWVEDASVPQHIDHIYCLNLTRSSFDDLLSGVGETFAETLYDKVKILRKTSSQGKKSRIHFHLWVDQTNEAAMTGFAKVPFTQLFEANVPEEFREDGSMTLQLNGKSSMRELPYSVEGRPAGDPL